MKGKNGWTTIDLRPDGDICWDLRWGLPFPAGTVSKIYSSHFLEHPVVPGGAILSRRMPAGSPARRGVLDRRPECGSSSRPTPRRIPDQERYFAWRPSYNNTTRIDYVNYIAYMDGQHRYMFDEENLIFILQSKGFRNVRLREFTPLSTSRDTTPSPFMPKESNDQFKFETVPKGLGRPYLQEQEMPPSLLLITNIPSHHQLPFGEAMHQLLGERFRLAFREPLPAERRELGWRDSSANLPFVIRAWESEAAERKMRDCIRDFDVVIKGNAPVSLVRQRILDGKLTFCAAERIWKRGFWRVASPRAWPNLWREFGSVNRANYHLLAMGAYCASDLARLGLFWNRAWKFGYFPAMPSEPPPAKPKETPRILWAGRMIDWKQATHLVQAAEILKRRKIAFRLDLFGVGPDRSNIERCIRRFALQDVVSLHASITPDQVCEEMRAAHIYVLPSSFQEGWGVVINEAMAMGCCVVSSNGPGAAVAGATRRNRLSLSKCEGWRPR